MLILPRIFSDGCILQRRKQIHIWGWTDTDGAVEVCLKCARKTIPSNAIVLSYTTEKAGEIKRFDSFFEPCEASGPYELNVSSDTDEVYAEDIYIGEVIHLAGQSNIEFPMTRVRDTYPDEFRNPNAPFIRTFKIQPNLVFTKPLADAETGEWVSVTEASLPDFSAAGYFLAKALREKLALREKEQVPIGLVNTTLGGSFVESWMSREMLANWPDLTALLEDASRDDFVQANAEESAAADREWNTLLDERDEGIPNAVPGIPATDSPKPAWWNPDIDTSSWSTITLPVMFSRIPELNGFTGSLWMKKTFRVPPEIAGRETVLWLGTMTDADETYINGNFIGDTVYKYPPRRYKIPAGVLHAGENEVTIRLKVEQGHGCVTPGKLLALIAGEPKRITDGFHESVEFPEPVGSPPSAESQESTEFPEPVGSPSSVNCTSRLVDLSGEWRMKKGCEMPKKQGAEFIIQRPAGCFNGMLAPVWEFTTGQVVWYQGESDSDRADQYRSKFTTLLNAWREAAGDEKLPFYVVVLPEYDEMNYEKDENPEKEGDWEKMQAVQRGLADLLAVYPVEIAGTGEINDLHPQRKKPVGERLAEAMCSNWQTES